MSDQTHSSPQNHLSDASARPDDVLGGQNAPSSRAYSAPAESPSDGAVSGEEGEVSAQLAAATSGDELAGDEIAGDDASAEREMVEADDEAQDDSSAAPSEIEPEPEDLKFDWYILKVQSNREKSITDALRRRIRVEGLDRFFGEIVVPTEKVTEFKGGKKKVVRRKLYPGYIMVNMAINDETWFLVRETPGIGDFTGAGGKPTPMLPHEVQRIISKTEEKTDEAPKLKINFNVGARVKINEGTFENFEGEVSSLDEASGHVTVMINIFGRSTPVELEYWQIETI
jgi:transcriptional antiterminator NusG